MTGRGPEHQAHRGHDTGKFGQAHQIAGPATAGVLGHPVTRTFQHHDQRDSLLAGKLAQAVPLVGGTTSDGAAEHGDVLGPGKRRPPIDPTRSGHQRITGDRWFVHRADGEQR